MDFNKKNEEAREDNYPSTKINSWFVRTMISLGQLLDDTEKMRFNFLTKKNEVWVVPSI